MQNFLAGAIRNRSVVEFLYDGHPRGVEPHCLGWSSKGALLLRAFQISGTSSSGQALEWRLFSASKITNVRLRGDTFAQPRPGYTPNDSAMTSVIATI